jgi:hypothetical protein
MTSPALDPQRRLGGATTALHEQPLAPEILSGVVTNGPTQDLASHELRDPGENGTPRRQSVPMVVPGFELRDLLR